VVVFGWIVSDDSESKIAGNQAFLMIERVKGNRGILRVAQTDVSHIDSLIPMLFQEDFRRPRQIGIDQKRNNLPSRRQGVMRFPFDKIFGVPKRCTNIFRAQVVLSTDLFESHSASQSAENAGYRYSGASNYGFAVLNFRINDDTVVH
jgi:hypothetical protein